MGLIYALLNLGIFVFVAVAAVIACAGLIAVVRAAVNPRLDSGGKVIWIVLSLCVPGAAFLYFAFVERNWFLKIVGWGCIASAVLACFLGGSLLMRGAEKMAQQAPTTYSYSKSCVKGPNDDHMTCQEHGTKPPKADKPKSPVDSPSDKGTEL